ncbi:MAG: branched-chain amino acid transport system substrate-binding protein, partial [Mycobacterium sp.]|nr:branched-chain amino acid transport system substrate-binding protein [Mycobacterium sp.]
MRRTHLFRLLAIAVVSVAALVLAGCGGSGSSGPANSGPLKVGASLSLTGDFSDSGKAAQRGYELWADTVNKSGGILGRHV